MKILGIETSCDETAAAVVEDGVAILSNVVVSQIDIFAEYGGVIPEVAARSHLEAMMLVVHKALSDAHCSWGDIDAIAVTHAPGLLGSLLIGTLTARTLAILYDKPLYAVHHLKSHVYANWLDTPSLHNYSRRRVLPPHTSPQKFASKFLVGSPNVASPASDNNELCNDILNDNLQDAPEPVGSVRNIRLRNSKSFHAAEKTGSATRYPAKNTIDKPDETKAVTACPSDTLRAARHKSSRSGEHTVTALTSSSPRFPLLALVVSGGHTQILYMSAHNHFEIVGTTRDDAVGECFDKVAKILGLPYPGGPSIAAAALSGDSSKYKLPHPKIAGLDFSFSGLKTAVLRAVQKELGLPISHPSYDLKNHLTEIQVADFAASFQKTAVEILLEKLKLALRDYPEVKSVVFAGGVSANLELRKMVAEKFNRDNLTVYFPEPKFSGDNGAMVAAAAYFEIQAGVKPTDPYSLNIYPRIPIGV